MVHIMRPSIADILKISIGRISFFRLLMFKLKYFKSTDHLIRIIEDTTLKNLYTKEDRNRICENNTLRVNQFKNMHQK